MPISIPKVYFDISSNGKAYWFLKEPNEKKESQRFDSKDACISDAKAKFTSFDHVYLWDLPKK